MFGSRVWSVVSTGSAVRFPLSSSAIVHSLISCISYPFLKYTIPEKCFRCGRWGILGWDEIVCLRKHVASYHVMCSSIRRYRIHHECGCQKFTSSIPCCWERNANQSLSVTPTKPFIEYCPERLLTHQEPNTTSTRSAFLFTNGCAPFTCASLLKDNTYNEKQSCNENCHDWQEEGLVMIVIAPLWWDWITQILK